MALHSDPTLEPKSYRLPNLEVVRGVFDVAFRNATSVWGAFGWFDAGWIGVLAYGLSEYLEREDTNPIEFTIAPALFTTEREALERALSEEETVQDGALESVIRELDRGASPGSAPVTRHAVATLCWMVVNDKLRINIAFPKATSNYHPKVWLFGDGSDYVVIRGSANATRRGMGAGIEHLDVDCSWRDRYRVEEYRKMVLDWASGVDSMLLETVPLDLEMLKRGVESISEDHGFDLVRPPTRRQLDDALADEERAAKNDAEAPTFAIPGHLKWRDGAFGHQSAAVDAWEDAGRRGLFAIATGGGKTICANICAQRSYQEHVIDGRRGPLIIIVSAPTRVLISQWEKEMRDFGLDPLTPTLESKARRKEGVGNLMATLGDPEAPDVVPIIVTNGRMSEPGFHRAIKMGLRRARRADKDPYVLHIGDEAHTLGAKGFLKNLPDFADERLGLSATPIRQYDDEGSAALLDYFAPEGITEPEQAIVSRFTLGDAIACGALVPYDYHVSVVDLAVDEMDRYRELTGRIGKKSAIAGGTFDSDDALTALLMERRSILETAVGKVSELRRLLTDIDTSRMLLYTSSKNPAQFDEAHDVLHELGISHHQVTQDTTGNRQLLKQVMEDFANGVVDCLIAKRVLDEGVNVPATQTAVLLASSTTEREWIQRLGRVLRVAPNKTLARVHDVIALPPSDVDVRNDPTAKRLITSELERVRRIAESSRTLDKVINLVWDIERRYLGTEEQ